MPEPLHLREQLIFGQDAVVDQAAGRPFEQGSGALPREQQSKLFLLEKRLGRRPTEAEAQAHLRKPETGTSR
jgi:hypothetical protein